MQTMVLGFMFSEDLKNVLLLKKSHPEWQAGQLNGVGGKLEPEDKNDPHAAMAREFKEETGMLHDDWDSFCVLENEKKTWRVYIYSAVGEITEAKKMEDEEPIVVSVDNLPPQIIDNLSWLIPLALDPAGTSVYAVDHS